MPEQQYNITWIQKGEAIPSGVCPKCTNGELRASQYWEGVYCTVCKWKWRRSKFEPKSAEEKGEEKEEKFKSEYKPDLQDVIIANQEKIIKMLWAVLTEINPSKYNLPKYSKKEGDIPTIEE